MAFCTRCGADNTRGVYCGQCGASKFSSEIPTSETSTRASDREQRRQQRHRDWVLKQTKSSLFIRGRQWGHVLTSLVVLFVITAVIGSLLYISIVLFLIVAIEIGLWVYAFTSEGRERLQLLGKLWTFRAGLGFAIAFSLFGLFVCYAYYNDETPDTTPRGRLSGTYEEVAEAHDYYALETNKAVRKACAGHVEMTPECKTAAQAALPVLQRAMNWCSGTSPPACFVIEHEKWLRLHADFCDNLSEAQKALEAMVLMENGNDPSDRVRELDRDTSDLGMVRLKMAWVRVKHPMECRD
jgi:hypothetical protein